MLDELIVLDGLKGLTLEQARKFLDGKRDLLDANSSVKDYLSLAGEYASIGAKKEADELTETAVGLVQ